MSYHPPQQPQQGYPPQQGYYAEQPQAQQPPQQYYNNDGYQQQPPQSPPAQMYDVNGNPVEQQPQWVYQPHPPVTLFYGYDQTPYYPQQDVESLAQAQAPEVEKPECQDKCCVVTFLINVVVWFAMLCYSATLAPAHLKFDLRWGSDQIIASLSAMAVCFVIASVVLSFMQKNAKCMIWTSICFGSVVFVIFAVVFIGALYATSQATDSEANTSGDASAFIIIGVVVGIFAVLMAIVPLIYACCMRHRINFAATMIKGSIGALTKFRGTFLVSLASVITILAAAAFTLWGVWSIRMYYDATNWDLNKNPPDDAMYGLLVVILVSFYWISEFLYAFIHTVVCGVVGTYLYLPQQNFATMPSVKRALTTSFGSIAFASGLITMIRAGKLLARLGAEKLARGRNGGNIAVLIVIILLACVHCLFSCIERFLAWFNSYCLVRVALYGEGFVTAGKATWSLFLARGWTMMINDDMTSYAVNMGVWMCCIASFTACFAIWVVTAALKNFTQEELEIGVWINIYVPMYMGYLVLGQVSSAVQTLFVCWCEDPQALSANHPEMFQEIEDASSKLWTR